MPSQGWYQVVASQKNAGTLYNTYTTAKSVINAQDLYGLYANYFQIGSKVRITAHFSLSNIITTPGTVTFQVMLVNTVVFTTGAIQLNATAHTLLAAKLVVDLSCQKTNVAVGGAVAQLMGQGVLTGKMFTNTAAQTDDAQSDTIINVPASTPALGTAFDSTISQIIDFWVGFSISSAGNGIQMNQYDVELCN